MFDRYELGIQNKPDCNCKAVGIKDPTGEWVKYKDVKHLLERSDNSDYEKCLELLCELMQKCKEQDVLLKEQSVLINKHIV